MNKIKIGLYTIVLNISILIPCLHAINPSNDAKIFIALQPPQKTAIQMEKYGKSIWNAIHKEIQQYGLEFTSLYAKDLHLTLFYGNGNIEQLAEITQREISDLSDNPFSNISITGMRVLSNSLVIDIAGPGIHIAQQVSDSIRQKGDPFFGFVGHISIGRFKLRGSRIVTDADKTQIQKILNTYPAITQKINSIAMPTIETFNFNELIFKIQSDESQKSNEVITTITEMQKPYNQSTEGILFKKLHLKRIAAAQPEKNVSERKEYAKIFVGLGVPENEANQLWQYAKDIKYWTNMDLQKLGLYFVFRSPKDQVLPLFWGTTNDKQAFVRVLQNALTNNNNFSVSIQNIEFSNNQLIARITGDGNKTTKKIANALNEQGESSPYSDYIILGEFKPLGSQAITDPQKKEVARKLQSNPLIMQKIRNTTTLPSLGSFSLNELIFKTIEPEKQEARLDINSIKNTNSLAKKLLSE